MKLKTPFSPIVRNRERQLKIEVLLVLQKERFVKQYILHSRWHPCGGKHQRDVGRPRHNRCLVKLVVKQPGISRYTEFFVGPDLSGNDLLTIPQDPLH